ncbi:MAG: M36 family metallopeptidase, partial [Bacteroidota bacterium]
DGPYVTIQDLEAPNTAIATSSDGTFNYTRSQQGFEDVMVYYHIDSYQRYVQNLQFYTLQNSPLKVDPHGLNGQDNSHFVPQGSNSRLGFGEGCVDDAEDADVIIHEYGHALSYAGSPGSNSGTERNGLDEGIGDYVAASYSKALTYNKWKDTFTWDGHNECWLGRSASLNTQYPPSTSDFYVYGEIWASTLMEVYDEIGRHPCDATVFQSLYSHLANMTLTDAANVIMDADSALTVGAHSTNFRDAFCRRGIFSGTGPGQSCFVNAQDITDAGLAWELFPNPNAGEFTINIADVHRRQDLRFDVTNLLGQPYHKGEIRQHFTKVALPELPNGMYFVRIMEGEQVLATKKLEVFR